MRIFINLIAFSVRIERVRPLPPLFRLSLKKFFKLFNFFSEWLFSWIKKKIYEINDIVTVINTIDTIGDNISSTEKVYS